MKFRIFLSSALGLIMGLVVVEVYLSDRKAPRAGLSAVPSEDSPLRGPATAAKTQKLNPAATSSNPEAKMADKLPIKKRVEIWSEGVARIQENPQVIEDSLDQFSSSLSPSDIIELEKNIRGSQTQDERFLSTELLVRNKSLEAKLVLKEIALSPETEREKRIPTVRAEENALRMRAVEGLLKTDNVQASKTLLSEVQKKSDNSNVLDRSQRALLSLKGLAPAPEVQDQEALKKLLRQ